jgi:AcrR family transcriptional regulator
MMPVMTDARVPRQTDAGKASTRALLLDAAIHIAGTQGPDKITYRSVGAQAGMSHSLVRFYFGTREALVSQAFERAARRDAAEAGLLAPDVQSFAAGLVRTISDVPDRQLIQYDYLLRAVRGGGPLEPVTELYDYYIEQVAGTLANLGIDDPDQTLATLIFAALDGLVLQHSIYRSPERTERVLAELRRILTARA